MVTSSGKGYIGYIVTFASFPEVGFPGTKFKLDDNT